MTSTKKGEAALRGTILLFCAAALVVPRAALCAQQPPDGPIRREEGQTRGVRPEQSLQPQVELSNEGLPYYTIVETFYSQALHAFEDLPAGAWLAFLKRYGFQPESNNDRSLRLAMYKAKHDVLGQRVELDASAGPEAFEEAQIDSCWRQVAALRRIHTEFLDSLDGLTGVDLDRVFDETIRASVKIVSTGDSVDVAYFECIRSMDDLRFRG